MCLSLYSRFYLDIPSILSIILCYPHFFILMLAKHLQFYQKMTLLPFSIVFKFYLCAYHCIWVFSKTSSISWINLSYPQFYHTYVRGKYQFYRKMSPLLFAIIFVCVPLYLWKFPQKFSIFKFFLWISLIWCETCYMKSVLSENVSTSFFNYVIIVFVCLSLYMRVFIENLQFYQISYVILNFIIDMLDENLWFYEKMSFLPFSLEF